MYGKRGLTCLCEDPSSERNKKGLRLKRYTSLCVYLQWNPDILPKDILRKDILPNGLFAGGHIAERHFTEWTFQLRTSLGNGTWFVSPWNDWLTFRCFLSYRFLVFFNN